MSDSGCTRFRQACQGVMVGKGQVTDGSLGGTLDQFRRGQSTIGCCTMHVQIKLGLLCRIQVGHNQVSTFAFTYWSD
jgi:hypothetical protein